MCVFMLWVLNQVCLLFWSRLLHCKAAHPGGRYAAHLFLVEEPLAHSKDRTSGISRCPTGQAGVESVVGISATINVNGVAILTRNPEISRGRALLGNHGGPNGITDWEGVHQAGRGVLQHFTDERQHLSGTTTGVSEEASFTRVERNTVDRPTGQAGVVSDVRVPATVLVEGRTIRHARQEGIQIGRAHV